jgi:hypothetical protein
MEFDGRNGWRSSGHDGHGRFAGPWLLALGLALLAVGAGALALTTPTRQEKPVIHAARLP